MSHKSRNKTPGSSFFGSGSPLRSTITAAAQVAKMPLPGFAELKAVTNDLISGMKLSGYSDEQCKSLTRRLERLLRVTQSSDGSQHPCLSEMRAQLHEINETFEKEVKRQSRLGVFGAERREQILDELHREIDEIVEEVQLRMLSHASTRSHWTDRVYIIPEHEITDQVLWGQVTTQRRLGLGYHDHHTSSPDDTTTVTIRRGRFGKLSVVYKTYSSHSQGHNACEAVEEQLKLLSRILHPNVASVVGITQGYYGPSGIVIHASGIPLQMFLSQVCSGSALVRCMRGVVAACEALGAHSWKGFSGHTHFAVRLDGHVSALPVTDDMIPNDALHTSTRETYGFYDSVTQRQCNPVARLTSRICWDLHTRSNKAQLGPFLDSVAGLSSMGLTELELMRLAVQYGVFPFLRDIQWGTSDEPPFFGDAKEFGQIFTGDMEDMWDALREGPLTETNHTTYHMHCGSGNPLHIGFPAATGQWISIAMCPCYKSSIQWKSSAPISLYEFRKQSRNVARNYSVKLDDVSYCEYVECTIQPIAPQTEPPSPPTTLYFHRNPSSRLSPREFWGFLSTSPDPCPDLDDLEDLGWRFNYSGQFNTYCMADDWEFKYQKALRSGLSSIPGSYPGSYLEESSDLESSTDSENDSNE